MLQKIPNPSKTIGLLIGCILVVLLFFKWLPMTFLSGWLTLAAILGGVLFAVVFFMFLFSMESTDYAEDGGSNTDMVKGILGILSIFVFGYMLISKETKFESKELTKNGKYTTAVIVDGSVLRSRRNTSHQLKVRYKNEAGEVHTSKVLVSPAQYDRSYIGMKIPIIYSPSYPDMVRIEFQKVNFNQVPAY